MAAIITAGIIVGVILFIAFAILIEKLPRWLKELVLGHYLLSDIVFTAMSFIAFPVVGIATLLSAGIFCILITLYLMYRRSTQAYTRIEPGGLTLVRIVRYNADSHSNK